MSLPLSLQVHTYVYSGIDRVEKRVWNGYRTGSQTKEPAQASPLVDGSLNGFLYNILYRIVHCPYNVFFIILYSILIYYIAGDIISFYSIYPSTDTYIFLICICQTSSTFMYPFSSSLPTYFIKAI
jgi:hypothetical protein